MAFEISGQLIPLVAAADFSALQYRFIVSDANGEAAIATSAADIVDGVTQDNPLAGSAASIMTSGVSKITLGATLTAGNLVNSDATGRAAAATTGEQVAGRLLVGGAVNEIGTILLKSSLLP